MMRLGLGIWILLTGVLVALAPQPAQAGPEDTFSKFCSSWMAKLKAREQQNLKQASPKKDGGLFVVEYTGYSGQPLRCEAKHSARTNRPPIGKLSYHELRYRGSGKTPAAALASTPSIVLQTEVLEIFRFDGLRWVY